MYKELIIWYYTKTAVFSTETLGFNLYKTERKLNNFTASKIATVVIIRKNCIVGLIKM